MIIYLIKLIGCSAFFIFIYKILLEQESLLRFNRFYLLSTLLLSFCVPLITLYQAIQPFPVMENIISNTVAGTAPTGRSNDVITSTVYDPHIIILCCYALITAILFTRFIKNFSTILLAARRHPRISSAGASIVLLPQEITPHSFFRFVFVNQDDYNNGKISPGIIAHELAHIKQKHSLDILLLELIKVFCWFNPLFILFKKALLLNHEFLADEAVLKQYHHVQDYQQLLLATAGKNRSFSITSQFNYSITKKRLLMMTKSTPRMVAVGKQLLVLPALAGAVLLFSNRIVAQDSSAVIKQQAPATPSTQEGLGMDQLQEYETIVKRNTSKGKNDLPVYGPFNDADRNRLETLYFQMSKEQQAKQIVIFYPSLKPFSKNIPTKTQLDAWKNAKIYGVWIDGKRASNTVLSNYTNTDFAHVFVSKLGKNTVNYGKHYYQVDLMTNAYYDDYYKRTINQPKYQLGIKAPGNAYVYRSAK